MPGGEQIDGRRVLSFDGSDLQRCHEPCHGHPEVVTHQQERLEPGTVALAQGGDEHGVLLLRTADEPLLELVDDQQHLLAGGQNAAAPDGREQVHKTRTRLKFRARTEQGS